ncbi:hypothetical protein ID866_8405, partial [Astraeus odoratus]
MGKATKKSTRKFASSGQLKKTIEKRRKHQETKKKIQSRRGAKGKGTVKEAAESDASSEDENEEEEPKSKGGSKMKGMSVDDFLGAKFMNEDSEEEDEDMGEDPEEDEDGDCDESVADDQSFASVDDLEGQLAEKDPEFYKYLQEHDRELLEFDPNQMEDEDEDEDDHEDIDMEESVPILTKDILRRWQKALLEVLYS